MVSGVLKSGYIKIVGVVGIIRPVPATPTMSGVKTGLRFYCHRTLRYTSVNLILQQNVDKISIIGISKIVKDGIYPVLPVFEQERELGVRREPKFLRMIQFAFNLRNT